MTYVVQPGDTLSGIADRFGITVGQLLAANPQLANPDAIRAGDVLVIPPRDAPTGLPLADGLRDAAGDLVDEADQPAFAPGYADLTGFGVRLDPDTLYLELVLVAPPRPADPTLERLDYVVHLDLSGDGEADRRLRVSNALEPDEDFAAVLEDLATGTVSDPAAFPGTVSFGDRSVRIVIERAALGNPRRYDAAALVERRFLPDEPEAEVSVDRSPDQQWPRQNARWVSVGR
jgi:LysM repeat protein